MTRKADFLVIGAGPGGYAAAFRAADLGRKVVLVDARATLGGVCLNEGCIPSKALLHAAAILHEISEAGAWGIAAPESPRIDLEKMWARKDEIVSTLTGGLTGLARRRKVEVVQGFARFAGPDRVIVNEEEWQFTDCVIATGSAPVYLPGWPGDPRIWDSTAALELRSIPPRLVVVGGGIIGLEMATVYAALGSAVTIVELGPQIVPGADGEAAATLRASLEASGCRILTETRVTAITPEEKAVRLELSGAVTEHIEADAVIQAVGRRADAAALDVAKAGLEVRPDGTIAVDAYGRTGKANIYAVGDITGGPMLAHRATHQGKIVAELAAGHHPAPLSSLIPSVAYTRPELAWVGLNLEQAKAAGLKARVSSFPWQASGRNLASGGGAGLTRLVYCEDSGRLLGATLVGANAGELLAELTLAIEMGARLEDVALTVHAHPTLSETVAFAAERALGTLTDL
ncbi:dihydrolipoyl dehydrogenase [Shinella sp.]|uniref:dihydrolipoyl dehydrogenase n=1 Tax=Shinella sp. TaxID=1870904 RepID=UPI003F6F2324